MFSFIRKFFENRRKQAAERDRLCQDLLERVLKALSDYDVVDENNKESIQKWRNDNENLVGELNDISRFKRTFFYRKLNQQKKPFDEIYTRSYVRLQIIYAREWRKQENDRIVSKKLKQLVSEQKSQKVKVSKSKSLDRKLGLLTSLSNVAASVVDCPCCGKDGRKKKLYSTEAEALIVAEHCSKERGYPLRVYPCPHGGGFHITSNPN